MNYTQGEWVIKKSESKPAFNIVGTRLGGKYKIARCPFIIIEGEPELTKRESDEAEANAKLIAASPELLEALIELVALVKNAGHELWIGHSGAEAAIKKATE